MAYISSAAPISVCAALIALSMRSLSFGFTIELLLHGHTQPCAGIQLLHSDELWQVVGARLVYGGGQSVCVVWYIFVKHIFTRFNSPVLACWRHCLPFLIQWVWVCSWEDSFSYGCPLNTRSLAFDFTLLAYLFEGMWQDVALSILNLIWSLALHSNLYTLSLVFDVAINMSSSLELSCFRSVIFVVLIGKLWRDGCVISFINSSIDQ